jgi:hypothetical protein
MIDRRTFALSGFCSIIAPSPLVFVESQTVPSNPDDSRVEVNLIPEREFINAGDVARIFVEVGNAGDVSVILPNGISIYSGQTAFLDLDILNAKGEVSPRQHFNVDSFPPAQKPDPIVALIDHWTVLHPNTSMKTRLTISDKDFLFLRTKGRYQLSGSYSTNGLLNPKTLGQIGISAETIAQFPFVIWRGKIETNDVVLRVV